MGVSRSRATEAHSRWQGDDDLFFHKRQIHLEVVLLCMGRVDHGTTWRVAQILRETPGGRLRPVPGGVAQRLSDTIVLQRVGANEIRRIRFAALSYSAIWRISAAAGRA